MNTWIPNPDYVLPVIVWELVMWTDTIELSCALRWEPVMVFELSILKSMVDFPVDVIVTVVAVLEFPSMKNLLWANLSALRATVVNVFELPEI